MNRLHHAGWKAALFGAAVLWALAGTPARAAEAVRVVVDDVPLTLSPAAAVQDGILYLPLRPLAQHFQATLLVDRQTIEVRRTDGGVYLLRLGRLEVWSGGVVIAVTEAPVQVVNGATMIPRGAVDVLFDTLSVWNRQDGILTIVSPRHPVETSTTAKPPSAVAARVVASAAEKPFEPAFRPEVERPIIASGYVTVGMAFGAETTASGRLQFRTHTGDERIDGAVAVAAGSSAVTGAGTITMRRPGNTLTVGGLSIHDSPLTLNEQGLTGVLYQTRWGNADARLFGGNIPGTSSHVWGMNLAFAPVGPWLMQGTMLYDPAGALVFKGRADRRLRENLTAFAEAAWGGSITGIGTAWRVGLETGSPVLTTSVSYLSLGAGFPTVGNATLFAGRSGPMLQLSYRPTQTLAFSASAAILRGEAGAPDRYVTSLLVHYRPTASIGIVGEMRSVEDTASGVPSRNTAAQAALTYTTGRWGWVLATSHGTDANLLLGTTAATTTFSLRAGYTLLNGLPVWAEVSRATGDTTSWSYALGYAFRLSDRMDLNTQVRHRIYTLPSAYSETSLDIGISQPLATGAHLTMGGGVRYTSSTGATTPYLAFQYGYPVYAYGPPQTGRLAAVLYVDTNGNGRRDPDEPGVGGIVLRINDKAAAMSDQQGAAAVAGVLQGEVRVAVDDDTVPAHLVAVQPSQSVRVTATQTTSVEFALAPAAAIAGVVFFDENNNGVREPGEKSVSGVILRLIGTERFRTSDLEGIFDFAHLPPGEYTVAVDPRSLPLGLKARGDGIYAVQLRAGGAVAVDVALIEGKPIIRTF